MWLGFRNAFVSSGNIPTGLGAAIAQFVIAAVVALLFSISTRYRNPRSRTKVVLWTSIVLSVVAIGNTKGSVAAGLENAAREINASAPKMVDAATRIDGATAGPGTLLTVRATFVAVDGRTMDKMKWQTVLAPNIRDNALKNTSLRKLVASGVSVRYRFSGRDGVLIDVLEITSRDLHENR